MGKLTMTRRTFAKMTAATAAAVGIAGTSIALAGFKIPDWQDYKKAFPGRAAHGMRGLRPRCPPYRTQSCSRNFQAGFTSMCTPSS